MHAQKGRRKQKRTGQFFLDSSFKCYPALLLPDLVDLWGAVGLQLRHQDTNDVHQKHQVNLIRKTELTKSRTKCREPEKQLAGNRNRSLYMSCVCRMYKLSCMRVDKRNRFV